MSKSLTKTTAVKNTAPSAPTRRDLQIYKGHVILQQDQNSIAFNFNISRSRISQVVIKVKRWLAAGGSPIDPEIRDYLAQQRLAKASQRIRLQRIIDKATYAAEAQLSSQKTTKTRYHGTTAVWHEETAVLAPDVNLPALRLLLRSVKALDDFEARHHEPAQSQPSPPLSEDQLLLSVYELLCRWRTRAEASGHFPNSSNIRQLIAENLHSLLGPLADALSNSTTTDALSLMANASDDVSPLEPTLIAPTPDQSTTSSNALTSPHKKITPKC